jgi:hypothetical protein
MSEYVERREDAEPMETLEAGEPVIGHPAVDAALRGLAEVTDAAPADQLPAYQAAHRTLREALASIDEGAPSS